MAGLLENKTDAVATGNKEDNGEGVEERFERELTWCVEQLQLGLETQNPDSRQAVEATKVLKILLSAKAPMVKKRQVMRNTFGDYRKKMQEQEKQSAAAAKRMKLLPVEDKGYQNSQFFRKSVKMSVGEARTQHRTNVQQSNNQTGPVAETNIQREDNGNVRNSATTAEDQANELNASFKFNFKLNDVSNEGQRLPPKEFEETNQCDKSGIEKAFKFCNSDNTFRFNFPCDDET